MENFKVGDVVARKSYDYDILFKIVRINSNGIIDLARAISKDNSRCNGNLMTEKSKTLDFFKKGKLSTSNRCKRNNNLLTTFSNVHELYNMIMENYFDNKPIIINLGDTCKLFTKIKEKRINTKISIYHGNEPPLELLSSNELIDKIQYYRILKNVTKAELADSIGVDAETYSNYERKRMEFINPLHINIILEKLDIKDKVEVPEFSKFISEYPLTRIVKILKDEKINKVDFVRKSGIKRGSIDRWFRRDGNLKIMPLMYKKLYLYWKKYRNYESK